ncbi:hypothetical protein BKA62DRAFT_721045 [Auriculariales sp. MPI-PUGE-AT-0066]|nr:hypothetical protein BKA62DRAFT_721045 [Auriculariales sp. MPI-PUGE-AT-0066]
MGAFVSRSLTISLPAEVWDAVLDELALCNEKPTIASLSITCRSLCLPSQRALFRRLKFQGRTNAGQPSISYEDVQDLRCTSSSRLRSYVQHVDVCDWLPDEDRRGLAGREETEESKALRKFPNMLSLKLSYVSLEPYTLERLYLRRPDLAEVHLEYCEWSGDTQSANENSAPTHGLKRLTLRYQIPVRTCEHSGGRIQIPALLHAARNLICPARIEVLALTAEHGLSELLAQLSSSKVSFPRLVSLTIMCPPASASTDLVALLALCPNLTNLVLDRRDYPSRRIQWTGPDQKDERDSIHSNSQAMAMVAVPPPGLLPNLKRFTGSLKECLAILEHTWCSLEHLELHRTFEAGTRIAPPPTEAINVIMDALENNFVNISCIDSFWDDPQYLFGCIPEAEVIRKLSYVPRRVRTLFPNLESFSYRGPIDRSAGFYALHRRQKQSILWW